MLEHVFLSLTCNLFNCEALCNVMHVLKDLYSSFSPLIKNVCTQVTVTVGQLGFLNSSMCRSLPGLAPRWSAGHTKPGEVTQSIGVSFIEVLWIALYQATHRGPVCLGRPHQGKLLLGSHKPLRHEKVSVFQIELPLLVCCELFCISSWENAPVFTRDTSEYIFRALTWFGNAAVVSLEDLEEVIVNGWMG